MTSLDIQLSDIIYVAHASGSRNLRRVLLVFVQISVDFFRNLGKRICRIACPEEFFRIEVIFFLWLSFRCHNNTIEFDFKAVRDQSLVCPAMRQN